MTRDDLCPDCGHHLHRPSPCQWRECSCGHDTLSADQQRIEPTPRTTEWWDGRIDGVVLDAEGRRFGVALPITVTPDDDPDFAIEAEAAEQSVPLDVERLAKAIYAADLVEPVTFTLKTVDSEAERIAAEYARLLPSEPMEPARPAVADTQPPPGYHFTESSSEVVRRNKPVALRERLAAIEHEQWIAWSREVGHEVAHARLKRWTQYWVPYEQLDESTKEHDRKWADKVLAALAASQPTAGEEDSDAS